MFSPIIGNNNYFNKAGNQNFTQNVNKNNIQNSNETSAFSSGKNGKISGFVTPITSNRIVFFKNLNNMQGNNMNNLGNDKSTYFQSLASNNMQNQMSNNQMQINQINPPMNMAPQQIKMMPQNNTINQMNNFMNNGINMGNNQNINNPNVVNFQSPYLMSNRTFNFPNPNSGNIYFSPIKKHSGMPTIVNQNQNKLFSPDINAYHRNIYMNNLNMNQNAFQGIQMNSVNQINQPSQMMNAPPQQPIIGSSIKNYPVPPAKEQKEIIMQNNMSINQNKNEEISYKSNKKLKKVKNILEEMAIIPNNNPITNAGNINPLNVNIINSMNSTGYNNYNHGVQGIMSQVPMVQNINLTPNLGPNIMNSNIQIPQNPNLTPNMCSMYNPNGISNIVPTKEEELNKKYSELGVDKHYKVTKDKVEEILTKIGKSQYIEHLAKDKIGRKVFLEIEMTGSTSIHTLISWTHYVSNALKLVNSIVKDFDEIILTEFIENNFLFKVKKGEGENAKTIGYLFTNLEKSKADCNITEYSIQQTSLEQIFNSFAERQGKTEEELQKLEKKTEILITPELISSLVD